ncbi:hypothetical protein [Paenibacillus sp. FSL L8-0463]|uniref:hypothetical protein n=1 Tax=Paenibacillus sp. FSL L8-0463 TaxID=2954687 RepID=UPI00311A531D
MSGKELSREAFEKQFKEVNASMGYEEAQLNEKEKDLLYRRLSGEISDQEYNEAMMEAGKK